MSDPTIKPVSSASVDSAGVTVDSRADDPARSAAAAQVSVDESQAIAPTLIAAPLSAALHIDPPRAGTLQVFAKPPQVSLDVASLRRATETRDFRAAQEILEREYVVLLNQGKHLEPKQVGDMLAATRELEEAAREVDSIGFFEVLLAVVTLGASLAWDALTPAEHERVLTTLKKVQARLVALRGWNVSDAVSGRPSGAEVNLEGLSNSSRYSPEYQRHLDRLTNSRVSHDNQVRLLRGHESFIERYQLIAQAKSSIHLQTLFLSDDETGWLTAEMLVAKSRGEAFSAPNPFAPPDLLEFPAGPAVEVRVIVDYKAQLGSEFLMTPVFERLRRKVVEEDPLERMARAGIRVEKHNPPWKSLFNTWHQKIMVVDGQVGFTGGMNVASEYAYGGTDKRDATSDPDHPKRPWSDMDMMVRGSAAHDLQTVFLENWRVATGDDLGGEARYFGKAEPSNGKMASVRVINHRPREDGDRNITAYYCDAIRNARSSIVLNHAYPIFGEEVFEALIAAASDPEHPVEVTLITNSDESNDFALMSDAAQRHYPALLAAGVNIYERRGEMGTMHQKVAVFDGLETIGGSWNLDSRSRTTDSEGVVSVIDADFAASTLEEFQNDIRSSERITQATVDGWGTWEGIRSWFFGSGVVKSYL